MDKNTIEMAIRGLETEKAKVEAAIADLKSQLGNGRVRAAIVVPSAFRKRRTMSASARKAISEAQKKRWAATKSKTR